MKQIDDKHAALGGAGGVLGSPKTASKRCPDQFGWYRHFTGGSIYWHPDTGARAVFGEILKKWSSLGWENSWLGYPISDEQPAGTGGRMSRFQNGVIDYDPSRGTHDLEGVGCAVFFNSAPAQHDDHCKGQPKKGRRLIALSLFGDLLAPRYASVWTSHAGPKQRTTHHLTEQQYSDWQKSNKAEGFHTTILAVNLLTAPFGQGAHLFAAAAEKATGAPPVSRYHLSLDLPDSDKKSLHYWTKWARVNGFIPTSLDLYEANGAAKAAIVLSPNPTKAAWNSGSLVQNQAAQTDHYNLHVRHGERPALTTRQVKGIRLTLYREDHVGFWFSQSEQTEAQVRATTDTAAVEGKYPISITAAATGRYTTIWASRKDPLPNRWAIVGQEIPALAEVDSVVKQYMQDADIRCASVSVGKDGRLVYSRTFTWAPPTYPIATPRHIFRIGSCTKVFTALVAHQLIDEAKLLPDGKTPISLDSKLLSTLGITSSLQPGGNVVAGAADITLKHLLNHTSRLADRDTNADRKAITKAVGKSFADTSKHDCVRHLVGFDLKPEPAYTNNGYVAAGAVVEAVDTVAGKSRSLFSSIVRRVLKPLGLGRPAVSGWSLDKNIPWSVHQHTAMLDVVPNALASDGRPTRSNYENGHPGHGEACGSLAFSASDMIKMLSSFTCGSESNPILSKKAVERMWPPMGPLNGFIRGTPPAGYDAVYWHNGAVAGGHGVFAMYRKDDGDSGATVADFYNKDAGPVPSPYWDPIIAKVKNWPDHDLFASVDIPPHA